MTQGKNILEVSRVLRGKIGESISFGSSAEYWEVRDFIPVGELRTVIVESPIDSVRIQIIGKGIDALWNPFAQIITGKGSKKFTEELSEVGRDATAWFTSELDPTDPPEPEPEQAGTGIYVTVINCPNCNTANAFLSHEYASHKKCSYCEDNLHVIDGRLYHSSPKNKGVLTKEQLERVADGLVSPVHQSLGAFIADPGYKEFADLDGREARRYLESKGFTVIENRDTGHNGYALTECGVKLSTNGFLGRTREMFAKVYKRNGKNCVDMNGIYTYLPHDLGNAGAVLVNGEWYIKKTIVETTV